jgi:hypothetical protein
MPPLRPKDLMSRRNPQSSLIVQTRRPDVQANLIAQADTAGNARLEPAAPFSIAESMARRAW